jgi:hypothetical protein
MSVLTCSCRLSKPAFLLSFPLSERAAFWLGIHQICKFFPLLRALLAAKAIRMQLSDSTTSLPLLCLHFNFPRGFRCGRLASPSTASSPILTL